MTLISSDFESRQQLRDAGIVAIKKAIEIISSSAVPGDAAWHLSLPALLQVSSFALLRADSESQASESSVAAYLRARAAELNSRVLGALAQHVSQDPFGQVKRKTAGGSAAI